MTKNRQNEDEIWVDSIEALQEMEYSLDDTKEYEEMYDNSLTEIKQGVVVEGKVVNINPAGIAIDIGFKSEGIIPIEEIDNIEDINLGDIMFVYLESVEGKDGNPLLSKKKADFLTVWEEIKRLHEDGTIVKGKCLRRVKGGIVVDIKGIDAFLPGSQIDVYPIRDFDALINQTLDMKIVKINEQRKNIVLSRKVILSNDLNERRESTLKDIKIGDIKEATVKNITDFGVFVDINGLDGLIYITDLSWGRINHPSEICKLDQKLNIQILDIDYDKKRVSAGLKQLSSHPWDGIELKYPERSKITGKIVSITDYGAFVEIEKGIEGLIHISEMSWVQHVKHPSSFLHLGDIIEAVVLNIKKEDKKISLGLKQLEPNPWDVISEKYPVGSKHKGIVRNLTQFGAFVEIEEGIDGLIHISDLSWTKKVKHPKEIVNKNDEIEVVILDINKEERRIALGYKQLAANPWERFEEILKPGYETTGTIVRKVDKGFIIELENPEVEGFMLASKEKNEEMNNIKEGDKISVVVTEFDKENKRIALDLASNTTQNSETAE